MNNELKDRLFVAVASHCANEGRAWALVDIVLADLAGELRDAECWRKLTTSPAYMEFIQTATEAAALNKAIDKAREVEGRTALEGGAK